MDASLGSLTSPREISLYATDDKAHVSMLKISLILPEISDKIISCHCNLRKVLF